MSRPVNGPRGWLRSHRFTIARRLSQLGLMLLFAGTARWGWSLLERPLLSGDLSASSILDAIPLSDPFALLQKICSGTLPDPRLWLGAGLIFLCYLILGGRSFCAWVCPMNLVTDLAAFLRQRLGLRSDWVRVSARARYAIAAGVLVASALCGTAAFEWLSPQAFLWRELVWGLGWGALGAVLGVFALDLLVLSRGWCGHLCPLGAFWSCAGAVALTRPLFDDKACDRCGDCLKVCPEPGVINLNQAAAAGRITGIACTLCGRCLEVCPRDALRFGPRPLPGRRAIPIKPDPH